MYARRELNDEPTDLIETGKLLTRVSRMLGKLQGAHCAES